MDLTETRRALQQVAVHVLARCRHASTGRFGLRATPGGFGTPAFGDAIEVLRVAGTFLVRERGGDAGVHPLDGATLAELAEFAGADLSTPFAAGEDTPPLGAVDEPLAVDPEAAVVIAGWYELGWRSLDTAIARSGPGNRPSTLQLWPEHFDAGCSVAVGPGDDDRCNLGASPGDAGSDEPYLYVGPWGSARPGDPAYWNASFGAVLPRSAVVGTTDPLEVAVSFYERGLRRLAGVGRD